MQNHTYPLSDYCISDLLVQCFVSRTFQFKELEIKATGTDNIGTLKDNFSRFFNNVLISPPKEHSARLTRGQKKEILEIS